MIQPFAERQDAIRPTLEYFGLDEPSTVVIGGAALAAAGIDAYIPSHEPFDVDAIIPASRSEQLCQEKGKYWWDDSPDNPLSLSVFRDDDTLIQQFMGPAYRDMLDHAIQPPIGGNFKILRPEHVAVCKLRRGTFKDIMGLAKADIHARTQNHSVVENPTWRLAITHAKALMPEAAANERKPWFQHPVIIDLDLG